MGKEVSHHEIFLFICGIKTNQKNLTNRPVLP